MNKMRKAVLGLATAGLFSSGVAQATLLDRGGGLLYDTVLDVTWLQDANYAKTSSFDSDGKMSWQSARSWAANLVYHDNVRNADYSGWRLATTNPSTGQNWSSGSSFAGTKDFGYNITNQISEMAYMYYVNLGLIGNFNTIGAAQNNFGVFRQSVVVTSGEKDIGLVKNLQSSTYWYDAEYLPSSAIGFVMSTGFQGTGGKSIEHFAWAVHDGDVAALPEPETYAMFLAGLGLMGAIACRRKEK